MKETEKSSWEKEQEVLRRTRERVEQSANAERLDSKHIDMSRDGIGKNKAETVHPQRDAAQPHPSGECQRTPTSVGADETEKARQSREAQMKRLMGQAAWGGNTTAQQHSEGNAAASSPPPGTETPPQPSQEYHQVKPSAGSDEMQKAHQSREAQMRRLMDQAAQGGTRMGYTSQNVLDYAARKTQNDTIKGIAMMSGTFRRSSLRGATAAAQQTNDDTLRGISKGARYTYTAATFTRAALTGAPAAALQRQVRNPIGLDPRKDQLDKELVTRMSRNGEITHRSKKVDRLARLTVRDYQREMEKQFGEKWSRSSTGQIRHEITQQKKYGRDLKGQIRTLEMQGAKLTSSQRKELRKLKQQCKDIGTKVGKLQNGLNAKKDLEHLRLRSEQIHKRAQVRQQPRRLATQGMVSLAGRAMMQDENTQGLATGIQYATNPHIHHAVKTTTKFAVKTALIPTRMVIRRFAPELPTRTLQLVHRVQLRLHHSAQEVARKMTQTALKVVPTPVKKAVKPVARAAKHFGHLPAGIRNAAYRAESRVLQNRVALGIRRTTAKISAGVTRLWSMVKGGATKILLYGGGALLTLVLVSGLVSAITGAASSFILSTESTSGGKIDLAPYARLIQAPMTRFDNELTRIKAKYANAEEDDTAIKVTYSGSLNNVREMLSMMAVRFSQNLDLDTNNEIGPYLTELFNATHKITVQEHRYECEGCKSKILRTFEKDPVTFEIVLVEEVVRYCGGHLNVNILVSVQGFDRIFDCDTYTSTEFPWEGWTEEMRTWVKQIYDQDWSELYDGLGVLQSGIFGGITSSADEAKIWDYILEMVGGNAYGAAGLIGNLQSESRLMSTNMEDYYQSILGYDDISYTDAVDSGKYTDFCVDSVGYGLAQWTDVTRKTKLWNLAQSMGVSVGNLDMQLALLRQELSSNYSHVLNVLRNADSVKEASDYVLTRFECPLDQSNSAKEARASIGEYFYNKYVLGVGAEGALTAAQQSVIEIAMNSGAYGIRADAGYCQRWAAYCYSVAGFRLDSSASAKQSGLRYGVSSDFSIIPPGAAIYGRLQTQYGHVGIYVGNGLVYHNIGGVAVDTLEGFIKKYSAWTWGWLGGTDLTQE